MPQPDTHATRPRANLDAQWQFDAIHPDPVIAREVVIDTLLGALDEAARGLDRALDVRCATPEGLAVKRDVRHSLAQAERALAWRGPGPVRWASDTPTTATKAP